MKKYIAITISLILSGGAFLFFKDQFSSTQKTLTVYFTGNVLGRIRECGCSLRNYGGIYSRANFIAQKKSSDDLWLDYGEYFFDPTKAATLDPKRKDLLFNLTKQLEHDVMNATELSAEDLSKFSQDNATLLVTPTLPNSEQNLLVKNEVKLAFFMVNSNGETDNREQVKLRVEQLDSSILPIIFNNLDFEKAIKLSQSFKRPVLIFGNKGLIEDIVSIKQGESLFLTGTETGRQVGWSKLLIHYRGNSVVNVEATESYAQSMSTEFKEGVAGDKLTRQIEAWEKLNEPITDH